MQLLCILFFFAVSTCLINSVFSKTAEEEGNYILSELKKGYESKNRTTIEALGPFFFAYRTCSDKFYDKEDIISGYLALAEPTFKLVRASISNEVLVVEATIKYSTYYYTLVFRAIKRVPYEENYYVFTVWAIC